MTVRPTRPRQGWLLATLLGGMFLGNVDLAIVNIAAPTIRDDLQVSDGALELVVSGYTLAYALSLITSARLGASPAGTAGCSASAWRSSPCPPSPAASPELRQCWSARASRKAWARR